MSVWCVLLSLCRCGTKLSVMSHAGPVYPCFVCGPGAGEGEGGMDMCVSTCVCMCVCLCVCLCVCVCLCTCVCACVRVCTSVCVECARLQMLLQCMDFTLLLSMCTDLSGLLRYVFGNGNDVSPFTTLCGLMTSPFPSPQPISGHILMT